MKEQFDLFGSTEPNYWLPKEFYGKPVKSGDARKGASRSWTPKEEDWAKYLREEGLSMIDIAKYLEREPISVSLKLKRLAKKDDIYNEVHREDKYEHNEKFYNEILPVTILDLYAGEKSYWEQFTHKVIANDITPYKNNSYSEDALKLLGYLYYADERFDLIDLDPFGSAYDCFDLAIKMAKKGVIITFGEIGHKRFKRIDFVSRYYGITNFEDFTIENLIKEVVRIGHRNKKELIPTIVREYKNITRVYFKIEQYKIKV